jgi:hypothetical protein
MVRIRKYHFFVVSSNILPTRFFNDTELKTSAKHKIEAKQNVFSLTINKCDHPDVGTYRVHVDNGIDTTDQTAKLNVGGMFSHFIVSLGSMHIFP